MFCLGSLYFWLPLYSRYLVEENRILGIQAFKSMIVIVCYLILHGSVLVSLSLKCYILSA